MRLRSYSIDDPLELSATGAVEVTVTFDSGEQRWCFFFTPEGLTRCGDLLPASDVRLHLGVPHMLVASRLDADIIQAALHDLDSSGQLVEHTCPLPRESNVA